MKKYLAGMIISVFAFIAILSLQAFAAENPSVSLTQDGNKADLTLTSSHLAAEKTSSMQLSLQVSVDTEAADVQFDFNDELSAKIMFYRYHEDTQMLNIYMAGTKPLFKNDTLNLGQVVVSTQNKESATAEVSVKEGSVKFVKGTKLVALEDDMEYPKPVSLVVGNDPKETEELETPTPSETEYDMGDVNMDNAVNAVDALIVLKHAARLIELSESEIKLADMNENGALDAGDALIILKIAAKLL